MKISSKLDNVLDFNIKNIQFSLSKLNIVIRNFKIIDVYKYLISAFIYT